MKERKISRRAVCSAMVASLALGVLEGCGSSSSTTASSAAGSGAAASNERITVRILKSKAANEVAAEQMDVWKVLGEKFNMDFEFDNPPQDNYNERLNLVMMDAQLPDIIMDMPTTEVLKYGESGVILSLNDYIDNSMPNLKKEIDKRDGVEKALTYSDGNIYYMPFSVAFQPHGASHLLKHNIYFYRISTKLSLFAKASHFGKDSPRCGEKCHRR